MYAVKYTCSIYIFCSALKEKGACPFHGLVHCDIDKKTSECSLICQGSDSRWWIVSFLCRNKDRVEICENLCSCFVDRCAGLERQKEACWRRRKTADHTGVESEHRRFDRSINLTVRFSCLFAVPGCVGVPHQHSTYLLLRVYLEERNIIDTWDFLFLFFQKCFSSFISKNFALDSIDLTDILHCRT